MDLEKVRAIKSYGSGVNFDNYCDIELYSSYDNAMTNFKQAIKAQIENNVFSGEDDCEDKTLNLLMDLELADDEIEVKDTDYTVYYDMEAKHYNCMNDDDNHTIGLFSLPIIKN